MPILTPTNNPGGAAAGLPDVADLARLAGELFARLPGQSSEAPVARPSFSAAPAHPAFDSVQLAPKATLTPNYYFFDETAKQAASQRQVVTLDQLAAAASQANSDQAVARSFALPGQDKLNGLLAQLYPPAAPNLAQAPAAAAAAPAFYFQTAAGSYWDAAAPTPYPGSLAGIDVAAVRRDFPILAERVNGKPLIWFDNAATTHKPQAVIDRLSYFYQHENSNIHRAAHTLAARASDAYEGARLTTARFLGAASPEEIIFVRGATEAINLVAQTFGRQFIGAGDEIIVSQLEHHANIVPWQQLAAQTGARIRVIPVDNDGQILLDEYRRLLNSKTRLVAVTQVSNALGTITPVAQIIALAHSVGARVLIDGAQAVSHLAVDVQALDADFYVFSGHKIFGPTGIGVLYGKRSLLEQLPPWQGGGNMIADVTFEHTRYQAAPNRFEAGTGNIADAVGLATALDYVSKIGLAPIAAYEHALLEYASAGLRAIPGVRLIGTAAEKASVASFVLANYKTEEIGQALNAEGVAVRSGHHCAQPILRRFGLEATVRPSFAFYNTCEEIDTLLEVVRRLAHARKNP